MSEPTKIQELHEAAKTRHGPLTGVGHERYVAMVNCCEMLEQIEGQERTLISPNDYGYTLSEDDMAAITTTLDQLRETL
jgi:hypothetical protein